MKRKFHISVDLGDTIFDRSHPKVKVGKCEVRQLFPNAYNVLSGLESRGHKFSIISKIDKEADEDKRLLTKLCYCKPVGIIPWILTDDDVYFCYTREEKGPIAARIGAEIHIDDRIEGLNAVHAAGIPYKILFIEGHDERIEREDVSLSFGKEEGLYVAENWHDVIQIINKIACPEDETRKVSKVGI